MSSHKHQNERVMAIKSAAIMLVIIGIIATVVYSISFMNFQRNLDDARASVEFKTVIGKVKSSRVQVYSGTKSTTYDPIIDYEYSVAGTTYSSDQIMFPNPSFYSHDEAAVYVKRYPAHHSVKVFYDPANPEKCCLEKGVTARLKNDEFYQQH